MLVKLLQSNFFLRKIGVAYPISHTFFQNTYGGHPGMQESSILILAN